MLNQSLRFSLRLLPTRSNAVRGRQLSSATNKTTTEPTAKSDDLPEGPTFEPASDVNQFASTWTKKLFGSPYEPQGGMFRTVLVVGGSGALGRAVVHEFRLNNYSAINVDLNTNDKADHNILVSGTSLDQDINKVETELNTIKANAFDAIICTAGAWEGGSIVSDKFGESLDRMLRANLHPSILAGRIATQRIKDDGCLTFTVAGAAVLPYPGMLAYGLAKHAVINLSQTLALDKRYKIMGLLPDTLDTPANRKAMPDVPTERWTPPSELAQRLFWLIDTGKYVGYRNPMFFGFETRMGETSIFDAYSRAIRRSPLEF